MRTRFEELLKAYDPFSKNGNEMEAAEADLLQYLRSTDDDFEQSAILLSLEKNGSILALPTLFGIAPYLDTLIARPQLRETIEMIKFRAQKRGSKLPDDFYTLAHWKPWWQGSRENFLNYVSGLTAVHPDVKSGKLDEAGERSRLGNLLVREMNIDISPYSNFDELRICTTSWDDEAGMQVLLDRLEEERVMEFVRDQGAGDSINSIIQQQLNDLRFSYLITRLKLGSHFDFYRFALEMAECYNIAE